MKKFMKNKKGFTIVELVIVIAVIGILAGVLIPTFSGIVSKANASAAQQEAKSALQSALAMSSNATLPAKTVFAIDSDKDGTFDYYFVYYNNKLNDAEYNATDKIFFTPAGENTAINIDLNTATAFKIDSGEKTYLYRMAMVSDKYFDNATRINADLKTNLYKYLGGTAGEVALESKSNGKTGYTVTRDDVKFDTYTSSDFETNLVVFVPVEQKTN